MAIDPLTPTILYAGTGGRGVFKSTDGGATWSAVNSGFYDNPWVWALAIDPLTPSTVYAGAVGLPCGLSSQPPCRGSVFTYQAGGLSLALSPNQPVFTSGDSLHLDLTFENTGMATDVDVYFGTLLPAAAGPEFGCPGGDAIAFAADNFARFVTTCLSAPTQSFAPFATNLPVAAGIPETLVKDFFSFAWPPSAPAGTYTFFLGLTSPGTLDVISLAQTTVSFSP